jgi:hypothetical protein
MWSAAALVAQPSLCGTGHPPQKLVTPVAPALRAPHTNVKLGPPQSIPSTTPVTPAKPTLRFNTRRDSTKNRHGDEVICWMHDGVNR